MITNKNALTDAPTPVRTSTAGAAQVHNDFITVSGGKVEENYEYCKRFR